MHQGGLWRKHSQVKRLFVPKGWVLLYRISLSQLAIHHVEKAFTGEHNICTQEVVVGNRILNKCQYMYVCFSCMPLFFVFQTPAIDGNGSIIPLVDLLMEISLWPLAFFLERAYLVTVAGMLGLRKPFQKSHWPTWCHSWKPTGEETNLQKSLLLLLEAWDTIGSDPQSYIHFYRSDRHRARYSTFWDTVRS